MTVRQMASRKDTSESAYVHLPAGTPFYVRKSYTDSWAVEIRGEMKPDAIWLTWDGWIYQDWHVLLPYTPGDPPAVYDLKPGTDGVWRYKYGEETYPWPVCWPELELLHTFR